MLLDSTFNNKKHIKTAFKKTYGHYNYFDYKKREFKLNFRHVVVKLIPFKGTVSEKTYHKHFSGYLFLLSHLYI